jgi:hypothetical protein
MHLLNLLCYLQQFDPDLVFLCLHWRRRCFALPSIVQIANAKIRTCLFSVSQKTRAVATSSTWDKVLARLSFHINKSITTDLSENLCGGVLRKILHLYLRIRLYSELPVFLKGVQTATKKANKSKKNRKLAKLQHL